MMRRGGKYGVSAKAERTIDGIVFASKAEARRYAELRMLSRTTPPKIVDLELQPRFTLQEKFVGYDGVTQRAIVYVADFRYKEPDPDASYPRLRTIVEDVKGHETPVWKIKRKMFMKLYPQWILRVTK